MNSSSQESDVDESPRKRQPVEQSPPMKSPPVEISPEKPVFISEKSHVIKQTIEEKKAEEKKVDATNGAAVTDLPKPDPRPESPTMGRSRRRTSSGKRYYS